MRRLAPLALLLAACFGSRDPGPYVRITVPSGRVYYANTERTLYSETGGFLTFRDLVTREDVRLKNGEYVAAACPVTEVEVRQREYINDPSKLPRAEPE